MRKLECPYCKGELRVMETASNGIRVYRKRKCLMCGKFWGSEEQLTDTALSQLGMLRYADRPHRKGTYYKEDSLTSRRRKRLEMIRNIMKGEGT